MRTTPLLPSLLALTPHLTHAAINWDIYEHGTVPSFKWSRAFPDDGSDPLNFHVHCRHSASFKARQYKLRDLPEQPPAGLAPWRDAIEAFLRNRDYMGSWDGVDHGGLDREVVVMEWLDVPREVRLWIEEQQADVGGTNEERWLFGVFEKPREGVETVLGTVRPPRPTTGAGGDGQEQHGHEQMPEVKDEDKIVVFPAGAIYEILPLWVAGGSGCERDFNNLAKYKLHPTDHAVLAWPVDHTKPNRDLGKRDMTFKIEALSVSETEDGKQSRLMWERMHRAIKRNDRKQRKEEREKAKKEMNEGRVRDEL